MLNTFLNDKGNDFVDPRVDVTSCNIPPWSYKPMANHVV